MEAWISLIGSIIVALISLAGVLYANKTSTRVMMEQIKAQSDKSDAKLEKAQAVTDTKLEELTREVRKHNNFAERIPLIEEKITVANHRIDNLERGRAG